MSAFWHDLVTQKSWEVLKDLRARYRFTLIGGWAVFLYARTLKSKDIDLILDYDELGRFQAEHPLSKNERLRKYEAKDEEIDIDVYTPHYSHPGLPAEEVLQHAFAQRSGSAKGEKDRLDILSLLAAGPLDWAFYREESRRHRPRSPEELLEVLEGARDAPELGLNAHRMSRLKRGWRKSIG